jgi:hypothetical protein
LAIQQGTTSNSAPAGGRWTVEEVPTGAWQGRPPRHPTNANQHELFQGLLADRISGIGVVGWRHEPSGICILRLFAVAFLDRCCGGLLRWRGADFRHRRWRPHARRGADQAAATLAASSGGRPRITGEPCADPHERRVTSSRSARDAGRTLFPGPLAADARTPIRLTRSP